MHWLDGAAEDDAEHFTAHAFLNYALGSRGLTFADLAVRSTVVATFQPYLYTHLVMATKAEEAEAWGQLHRFPLAHGAYQGHDISIASMPVGAPPAVMYLEMLAAGGGGDDRPLCARRLGRMDDAHHRGGYAGAGA